MTARLLLANSNTTAAVTDCLVRVAREVATPGLVIEGATAACGSAAIQTNEEVRIASAATLDLLDQRRGSYDAAIIACFADPGLTAAGDRYDVPILGLGRASLFTAVGLVGRVAILTSAGSVAALTRSLIEQYHLAGNVAAVVELPVALQELTCADAGTFQSIEAVLTDVLRAHDIRGILLGGAFFAGLAGRIHAPVPVFDPIALAVGCAELCLRAISHPTGNRPST